jgi:hypothetical protein
MVKVLHFFELYLYPAFETLFQLLKKYSPKATTQSQSLNFDRLYLLSSFLFSMNNSENQKHFRKLFTPPNTFYSAT